MIHWRMGSRYGLPHLHFILALLQLGKRGPVPGFPEA